GRGYGDAFADSCTNTALGDLYLYVYAIPLLLGRNRMSLTSRATYSAGRSERNIRWRFSTSNTSTPPHSYPTAIRLSSGDSRRQTAPGCSRLIMRVLSSMWTPKAPQNTSPFS